MTIAQQISDALVATLSSPVLVGLGAGGVTADPDYHYEARDLPAVAVYLGDETRLNQFISASVIDRLLTITVRIISQGSDAYRTGNEVLVQAYNQIMSDLTLGGLVMNIEEAGIKRSRELLEMPVVVTDLDLSVKYRTAYNSL